MLKNLWITGYRSYEIGMFKDDDPKASVIQKFFEECLINYIEDGTEWVLTGAQLGTEQIIGKAVTSLKDKGYNIKHAVMLPFAEFGDKWNDNNKRLLNIFLRNADYVNKLTNMRYHSGKQLKIWQNFMLEHSDGSIIFYDPESGGKPQYDYDAMKNYVDHGKDYQIELVDFDTMQDFANIMYDN
ncbi:SLOG family protein [Companilactobacillus tucceti]|nr:SLOG family protein [Companilactobacillus tucceti]